jgi:hypothetical protein
MKKRKEKGDIWTRDGFRQLNDHFVFLEGVVIFCEDLVRERLANVKACGYDCIVSVNTETGHDSSSRLLTV